MGGGRWEGGGGRWEVGGRRWAGGQVGRPWVGEIPRGSWLSVYLPAYLSTCRPVDFSIHLSVYLPIIYLLACAFTTACCCSGVIGSGSRSR